MGTCFVTVGTTCFDGLVDVIDDQFYEAVRDSALGVANVVVQQGTSGPASTETSQPVAGVAVRRFALAPTIQDEMQRADLIIGHAGAGTCSEVLSMDKPLIVVVNESLMGNHQWELARALVQRDWALATTPAGLLACVEHELGPFLRRRRRALPARVAPAWDVIKAHYKLLSHVRSAAPPETATTRSVTTRSSTRERPPPSVMVVVGSGGHTAELCRLLRGDPDWLTGPLCHRLYVLADSDRHSEGKIRRLEAARAAAAPFTVLRIPRAREVKQSYFTSIFTLLRSIVACFRLVWSHRPAMVLCNGPGTCLPVCMAARLLDLLPFTGRQRHGRTPIVFVESVCRVDTLSATLRLLLWFHCVTLVVLQWPAQFAHHAQRFSTPIHLHNIFFQLETP